MMGLKKSLILFKYNILLTFILTSNYLFRDYFLGDIYKGLTISIIKMINGFLYTVVNVLFLLRNVLPLILREIFTQ